MVFVVNEVYVVNLAMPPLVEGKKSSFTFKDNIFTVYTLTAILI